MSAPVRFRFAEFAWSPSSAAPAAERAPDRRDPQVARSPGPAREPSTGCSVEARDLRGGLERRRRLRRRAVAGDPNASSRPWRRLPKPRFIRTVSRHGYQFVFPEVAEEADDGQMAATSRSGGEATTASVDPLVDRLVTVAAEGHRRRRARDLAEQLHGPRHGGRGGRLSARPRHAPALAMMRDARWTVPDAGEYSIPLAILALVRLQYLPSGRWWHADGPVPRPPASAAPSPGVRRPGLYLSPTSSARRRRRLPSPRSARWPAGSARPESLPAWRRPRSSPVRAGASHWLRGAIAGRSSRQVPGSAAGRDGRSPWPAASRRKRRGFAMDGLMIGAAAAQATRWPRRNRQAAGLLRPPAGVGSRGLQRRRLLRAGAVLLSRRPAVDRGPRARHRAIVSRLAAGAGPARTPHWRTGVRADRGPFWRRSRAGPSALAGLGTDPSSAGAALRLRAKISDCSPDAHLSLTTSPPPKRHSPGQESAVAGVAFWPRA